ncbi:MAG: GTP 3',8-cyclase MoaA [Syntrophobacterales bacterium]|nr:MAG: GTP 3',8-cyclase MoaA [Syntrophobacterales bacterium]
MLMDNFARRINYLRISITDRCNLRCRYCMPDEGISLIPHAEVLRYEEILQVARLFVQLGINKIRLTGGEPLARKGVLDLIRRISRIQEIEDLSLTTNGVLLGEFASDLVRMGIKRINISLDTLNREKFAYITRRDRFPDVYKGIEKALEVGLSPVKLNVVAIKGFNDDEILHFAKLTLEKPLTVRFIEFMPTGGVDLWSRDHLLTADMIRNEIEKMCPLIPVDGEERDGPAARFRLNGAVGELGFISPISRHFCTYCNRLRLTPDGKLRACLFSDVEIDLKSHLRNHCNDEKLKDLLITALRNKPKKHTIDTALFRKCQRTMSTIGG